ncbi:MAG TPA: hypothetical protein VFH38_05295 [Jatrophihabitans sp.]|nr:hypothetical protein [Jatrophihabitans sp.]
MDGVAVVAVLLFTPYAVLAVLTALGSHRRGDSPVVSAMSAMFFPAAWTAWYVQDVLLPRRRP